MAAHLLEPPRDGGQQLVAQAVPQAVVHELEVVEVEAEERGGAPVSPGPRHGVRQPVGEQRSVGKT